MSASGNIPEKVRTPVFALVADNEDTGMDVLSIHSSVEKAIEQLRTKTTSWDRYGNPCYAEDYLFIRMYFIDGEFVGSIDGKLVHHGPPSGTSVEG